MTTEPGCHAGSGVCHNPVPCNFVDLYCSAVTCWLHHPAADLPARNATRTAPSAIIHTVRRLADARRQETGWFRSVAYYSSAVQSQQKLWGGTKAPAAVNLAQTRCCRNVEATCSCDTAWLCCCAAVLPMVRPSAVRISALALRAEITLMVLWLSCSSRLPLPPPPPFTRKPSSISISCHRAYAPHFTSLPLPLVRTNDHPQPLFSGSCMA